MDDFPAMLYRPGAEIKWEGMSLDTLVVNNADELADARADNWATATMLAEPIAPEPAKRPYVRKVVAVDAAAA